jgi:tetratricopeptide (TPR) repeat protein
MFRRLLLPCCVVVSTLVSMAAPRFAQASWVGRLVIPKKVDIKIRQTDKDGKPIHVGPFDTAGVVVLAAKDGWLKVRLNDGEGWIDQAELLLVEDAIPYFTQQINENPNHADAYTLRARAWYFKLDNDMALKDVTEALRISPTGSAYQMRGYLYLLKHHHDKALSDYSEAIRLNPKDVLAYYYRGMTYQGKKDYEKALSDYSEAFRLDPSHALACNQLAWIMATCPNEKHRNGTKAVEYAKKALALNRWKAFALDTLAAAYAEDGQFLNAVECQMQALEDPAYHNAYGKEGLGRLELYKNNKPFRTK